MSDPTCRGCMVPDKCDVYTPRYGDRYATCRESGIWFIHADRLRVPGGPVCGEHGQPIVQQINDLGTEGEWTLETTHTCEEGE